jgi:hypothetical protein
MSDHDGSSQLPEIVFMGSVLENTGSTSSPNVEGLAGSGKWYNANPPEAAPADSIERIEPRSPSLGRE